MHVCMYVCMNECMYACMYVCIVIIYKHKCIYICIDIYRERESSNCGHCRIGPLSLCPGGVAPGPMLRSVSRATGTIEGL